MNTATATPLIQGLAWSGEYLIATDPDVVDKRIRRKALSASTGKSMKGCLAKYAAEKLLPREKDPFSVSELGTSTHAIIEDMYNMPADDRTLDAFHALKDSHADIKWSADEFAKVSDTINLTDWEKTKLEWKGEIVRLGARVFEIEDPRQQTTYKTEMSFEGVTIAGGVPAMGFIDRVDVIVVREKDRFKIVDLKTGKMKSAFDLRRYGDDHGDQIRIYSDAVREVTGESAAVGEIHYTQFGTAREIPLSELMMDHTRKDFRAAWDIHNIVTDSGKFPTKTGPLCGWCPLVNACPAAKAAGKSVSDKVKDVPPSAVQLGIPTVRTDAVHFGSKLPVTNPVVEPIAASAAIAAIKSAPSTEFIPLSDTAPADPFAGADTAQTASNSTAHVPDDKADNNGTGTNIMSIAESLFSEGKPWEATINGKLNGASYAAIAVTSIPQMAGELLIEAGRPLNNATIDRLTDLLAEIIITVQKDVRGGEFNWDDGINTRIRGALRTTIETLPLPWDATDEAGWVAWQSTATKRTTIFIKKGLRLFNLGTTIETSSFSSLLPTAVASIASPKPGVQKVA
ncbi:PD-(D/E)XK nuclease family protein (plasmid) [Glaciihabitans sp. INWT7]|uniref:RecB family exonuclease n=1 Tax=Glaciihabitans sp. INWT7 TaxID=2596912 RepID=UPI0016241817|nr:PD-(D/E)XK nuclease family protein [Glaciihabitans sp. INWT7]QNE48700.1 PD-(D/E)XK nuclease family protein [Glaciihabitans sp. INWT7]